MLEDNDSHNKIAVITVDGIITSHTADQAGNNMVDVIRRNLTAPKMTTASRPSFSKWILPAAKSWRRMKSTK